MSSTVADLTERKSSDPPRDLVTWLDSLAVDYRQRWISDFAYFLWEKEGRPRWQAERHWKLGEAIFEYLWDRIMEPPS